MNALLLENCEDLTFFVNNIENVEYIADPWKFIVFKILEAWLARRLKIEIHTNQQK